MLETFAIATTNATNSVLPTTSTAMSGLVPFAGSMLACIGFALKKVVKWLLIGLGILAGLIFLAVQWMANNGYIQGVRWDKLGSGDIRDVIMDTIMAYMLLILADINIIWCSMMCRPHPT